MKKENNDETQQSKTIAKFITFTILTIIFLVIIFGSFYTITAGERGILLTWGKPSEIAINEGLHFKIPIAQSITKIDIQTQKYETEADASSSDLQIVSTKIAVNYHIPSDTVITLYRNIGLDYETKIIQPAVQEVVKASTAQYTAEQLITQREAVKEKIDFALKERLLSQGIYMETTSITNFDFSAQFNKAIEEKVTAEQEALTQKNRLAQVEYEAQQQVAKADGNAKSTILSANATAEAKLLIATAEAKALELQKQQVTNEVLQLRQIEVQKAYADKWNGNLPTTVIGGSQAIPVLQLPSNLVSTITKQNGQ